MPACDCLPMTADLESSVMFPNGECIVDHASDANAAFVKESRNNLPRLLALAKIGVLAVKLEDESVISTIGEVRETVAIIESFRDLIAKYKEQTK